MGPLLAGIVWIGLYPTPVLRRMEGATRRFLEVSGQMHTPASQTRLGGTVEARP
jgi:NADH:ubiquinone oxidoreductase subunit 4 (subunit M)